MNSKTLIAGLIGGIVFFLLGWLIFGILLSGPMESYSNMNCIRPEAEMNIPLVAVANLIWGFLFAYIFSKWPSVNSFGTGALQGAIISVLIGLSMDLFIYAFTTLSTSLAVAAFNVVGNAVVGAIGGGVIGWWLGRK